MESKMEKLEKRLTTPTINNINRKKIKSESKKKRVNYVTILSGEAFKAKTRENIQIKMKMPNSSQKPPASS